MPFLSRDVSVSGNILGTRTAKGRRHQEAFILGVQSPLWHHHMTECAGDERGWRLWRGVGADEQSISGWLYTRTVFTAWWDRLSGSQG